MVFRTLFNRRRERIHIQKELNKDNNPNQLSLRISKNLHTNIDNLKNLLDHPQDLNIRTLHMGEANIKCSIVFLEGIINQQSVQESLLGSLENMQNPPSEPELLFEHIFSKQIAISDINKLDILEEAVTSLLSGYTLIYIDGVQKVLTVNTIGGEQRAIEEPLTETLIHGPRSGFVENIQTNLALIRREIRDSHLRFKTFSIGQRGKQQVVITYVKGIVHPRLLDEIERRLTTIDVDIILGSSYIEGWIQDSFLSPFPQMINTERPDKVSAAIMQGKVAILVNGSPFSLILPATFANIIQSPEDYYERWMVGSLLRILRYLGALISVFLPALYIALISLQPEMLPSLLVFSIAGTREGVPFPPVIEAFLMVITMELLQEAGARLPQTIGQTIGIVGGLVIGEAAVQAGIVSPIMVIVIALTAIANFAIPSYSVAISFRIIRFGFMVAAGAFGLYGIILAYIMVNIHFVNLKSFGIPYSTPFAPFFKSDWQDVIIRTPRQTITKRPQYLEPVDDVSGSDGEDQ